MKLVVIICVFIFFIAYLFSEIHAGYNISDIDQIVQTMPWPGMLSDHPLYKLKNIRDLILLRLITTNGKKLEYDIFSSNKLFREMYIFYQRGDHRNAYKSGLKAQHFITRYVTDYSWLRSDSVIVAKDIEGNFLSTLANQKFVLEQMIKNSPSESVEKQYIQLIEYLKTNEKGLEELKKTM